MDLLNIKEGDVFYDIGSGIGNVVLQVGGQTGCEAHGIEIRPELHDYAEKMKSRYTKEVNNGNVVFHLVLAMD